MSVPLPRRRVLALAGLLAAGPAWAQSEQPAAPIQALDDALLAIMRAGATSPFADRARILAPAIRAAFDLPQILRVSVGPRWATLTAAEQSELADAFLAYTLASYVANFEGFSGERFEVLPQTRTVGADVVVETRIVPTSGEPTRIDYVMRHGAAGWQAVDVLLDGTISRVAVQRSDFRALLAQGGAAALVASLRAKSKALEAGAKP